MEDVDVLDEAVMADVNLDDAAMADAMDDLFGETSEALGLGAGAVLPTLTLELPPALLLRLADLQTSGCRTKLAWSNSGSIAQIIDAGTKIIFRVYSINAKTGRWALSDPGKLPLVAPNGHTFVHLEFNLLGHELAVLDSLGNIFHYSLSGGLGKMQFASLVADEAAQLHTELDSIAGMHWLPIYPLDCRLLYIGPASRSITGWTSQSRQREPAAVKVHHPADNQKALLYISMSGCVSLQYQQDGWRRVRQTLPDCTSLVSHADFCEHDDSMLLITYDHNKRLLLYQLSITWNPTYTPVPNQTQQTTSIDPKIQLTQIASTDQVAPLHLPALALTQLQLLPATDPIAESNISTTTTVLATYVHASTTEDGLGRYHESSTMLVRWQVESDPRTIHDSFLKLKPGTTPTNVVLDKTVLRRQPDMMSAKALLSIQSRYFNSVLLCTASDGTIELRDRTTFELLEPYMDTDLVTNLTQSGFSYDSGAHNIQAAVSNDGSAMVHHGPDGVLQATSMTFRYGWQSLNEEPNQLAEAAIVCIARQYMIMTCNFVSPDEVLSLVPSDLPDELLSLLLRESFRLTRYGPGVSHLEERLRQSLLMREPLMPKAYGIQLALGTSVHDSTKTLNGQLAWAVLNLRHITFSISQSIVRLDPSSPFPPELIHSLRGLCKWGVDAIIMLIGAFLTIVERTHQNPTQPAIQLFTQYMKDKACPIPLMLLCSTPRTLLKLMIQFLPRLIKFSQLSISRAQSALERQQLMEIGMMEKSMPFSFDAFKSFLESTETIIRSGVEKDTNSVLTADTVMSTTAVIPEELEKPLRTLLATTIPALMDTADLSKIYFADTSWLGLGGPGSVKAAAKYDVIRKLPLREDAVLRKCRRCGSMMEEIKTDKPREIMPWLMAAQRNCLCTCNWYMPGAA